MIDFMNERKVRDLVNSWDYVPSYEDKDGDWMLVGDVPWPYVFFFFSINFRSFLLIILITPFSKFTYLLECSLIHASVYVSWKDLTPLVSVCIFFFWKRTSVCICYQWFLILALCTSSKQFTCLNTKTIIHLLT